MMADRVSSHDAAIPGQQRSPVFVLLLSVLTLGIYQLYWWYTTTKELRDLGRSRATEDLEAKPWLSTLAFGSGVCLVVPFIWTGVATTRRIQSAERLVGTGGGLKAWAAIGAFVLIAAMGQLPMAGTGAVLVPILALVLRAAALTQMQVALNGVWQRVAGDTQAEREFPAPRQPVPVPDG
jgi:hypothetical protein